MRIRHTSHTSRPSTPVNLDEHHTMSSPLTREVKIIIMIFYKINSCTRTRTIFTLASRRTKSRTPLVSSRQQDNNSRIYYRATDLLTLNLYSDDFYPCNNPHYGITNKTTSLNRTTNLLPIHASQSSVESM